MPKLDLAVIEETNATRYPPEYGAKVAGRWYRRLAPAAGIEDFGASYVRLEPGAWSSQRHWHEGEDELLVVIRGSAVLIDEQGRTDLKPGDCCAFPKGDANGHHLVNESDAECIFVAIGRPTRTDCHYPDVDMHLDAARQRFVRKDGSDF